jgi:hypothetical protein
MTSSFAEFVLAIAVPDEGLREAILGDLHEDAAALAAQAGPAAARRWHRRQVFASLPHFMLSAVVRLGFAGWSRALLAAVGGYVGIYGGVIAADLLLNWLLGADPSLRFARTTTTAVVVSLLGAVAGGYLAAWLGRRAPYASALTLGLLFVIVGIVMARATMMGVSLWYFVLLEVTAVPFTLGGAALRVQQLRTRSSTDA